MSNAPKKPRQKNLPDKAALLREVEHWKWQALTVQGRTEPWLKMPGLVVYLDTADKSDLAERFAVLDLARKTLRT